MKQKLNKSEQAGRSMIEMLGVLAVIGVLSITGISGYTTAMNKHKANQILDAASKRAVAVSTQIQRGNPTPTLAEFDDNKVGGAEFDDKVVISGNQFKIGFIEGKEPSDEVWAQMQAIAGDNGIIQSFTGDVLTYNNDLTTDAIASDSNDPASCSAYTGTSSSGAGGYAGKANDNTTACYCVESGTTYIDGSGCTGETKPRACNSFKDCNKGQFCLFSNPTCDESCFDDGMLTSTCSSGTGICTDVSGDYAFPSESKKITGIGNTWLGPYLGWYSGNDWCQANNKDLISVEDFNCYVSGTNTKVVSGYGSLDESDFYCCASGKICEDLTFSEENYGLFSPTLVDFVSKYTSDEYMVRTSSSFGTTNKNSCWIYLMFLDDGYTTPGSGGIRGGIDGNELLVPTWCK